MLNVNLNDILVYEYQLKFISNNDVEIRTTLAASSFDCKDYKNDSTILNKSTILHYTFENGVLEIPDKHLLFTARDDGKGQLMMNTGEMLYTSSIVEHINDNEGRNRIQRSLALSNMGQLTETFVKMLHNNNEPAIMEENGRISMNPDKSQSHSNSHQEEQKKSHAKYRYVGKLDTSTSNGD